MANVEVFKSIDKKLKAFENKVVMVVHKMENAMIKIENNKLREKNKGRMKFFWYTFLDIFEMIIFDWINMVNHLTNSLTQYLGVFSIAFSIKVTNIGEYNLFRMNRLR
jgi:hypothetical protein